MSPLVCLVWEVSPACIVLPGPRLCGRAGEWLKSWAYKIAHVADVAREGALVQVAAIPGVDEELDGPAQGVERAREAARLAPQAGQIVAQLGIVGFNSVRLALAGCDSVAARVVDERVIGREIVGVVLGRLGAALHELLQWLCSGSVVRSHSTSQPRMQRVARSTSVTT